MTVKAEELFVPHIGWFLHETGDDVAQFLSEGWFEYREQAFVWLYARPGDVFIDCGAHFGLYSAVYAAATCGHASIWSIEPDPSTRAFLRRNLALHKNTAMRILECAVSAAKGTTTFYCGAMGKAAYGGLIAPAAAASSMEVCVTTLDSICGEQGISLAHFVKLDVEGSEMLVLKGASESIATNKLPVLMVEFTEQNLQRSGLSTKDLYTELASRGYELCTFDEQTLQLEPVEYTGPVWYDNYFAVTDRDAVNSRLRQATRAHRRIARAILRRGQITNRMRESEAFTRAEEADRRAGQALRLLEDAYARTGEANWRNDEANRRADEAVKLLNEAYARTGEANWRCDEANRRADEAVKQLNEAYARLGEANWRIDEANRRAGEAVGQAAHLAEEVANTQTLLMAAKELAILQKQELERLQSSFYARLGRKLRLLPAPAAAFSPPILK